MYSAAALCQLAQASKAARALAKEALCDVCSSCVIYQLCQLGHYDSKIYPEKCRHDDEHHLIFISNAVVVEE